jgi:hypothetical protein
MTEIGTKMVAMIRIITREMESRNLIGRPQ